MLTLRWRPIIFIISLMVAWIPATLCAQPQLIRTELRNEQGKEQLVIYLSEPVDYNYFFLDKPERLVINMPTIGGGGNTAITQSGAVIKNIRFGQFDTDTSRLVADLSAEANVVRVFTLSPNENEAFRVVFELEPVQKATALNLSHAKKPDIKKPIIVIDAGHGGVDPGAIARRGKLEKHITLEYARALRKALLATGKYRVVLTREDDRFILLRERIKIARRQDGAIFISLHADSAPTPAAKGLSVYTLSETASDDEAALLAAQENKSDILSGMDLSQESPDVADILIDLAQRETMNKSSLLGELLVKHADKRVRLLPKPHRFAGFAVLKAPDMPSVLVELGFLSHRDDERLLLSTSYRERVVRGMVTGIDAYFKRIGKD